MRYNFSVELSKGKLISIALAASGIPFKGRFDKERMLWGYDGIYKESVDEIIAKFTSEEYAEQRDEIAEHKGNDCFIAKPNVRIMLAQSELNILRSVAERSHRHTQKFCNGRQEIKAVIKRELEDVLMLRMKTF